MPSNKISSCNEEVRRGPWTFEEDSLLIQYITSHGEGRWNLVAKSSGLKRTGKSCRLRWLNYLKPDIKRGNLTPQEQLLILDLHSKWGNRWSKIAAELPGRTDNEIKNYWRTRVQRQARQLKIDSNSNKFIETLKHLWMPRLVEEMDQKPQSSSSFSSANTQNSETPSLLTISAPSENQMKFPNQPKIEKSSCLSEKECYHVDIGSLDVEDFNELVKGSDEISMSDCQIEGIDWINSEIASPFWNMDQLWEVNK